MAARRKTAGNRRRTKNSPGGIPAWFWLLGGIVIGLGLAVTLMFRGYLPDFKQNAPSVDESSASTESALIESDKARAEEPKKPRYDFFTVLPEREVVVPNQELSLKAEPSNEPVPGKAQDSYVLQAGSFRSEAEAEQMKATLALLGSVAAVQKVTVNGETWHRVRIGPIEGARKADEIRRMLSDNRIDTLVMKANP